MAKSDFRIDILGTAITISTDEEPERLNKLLDKYRKTIENVQNISGLKDPLRTAVLTGFLLCDELEKAGETAAAGSGDAPESAEAEKLTIGMISRLDELVPVDSENALPANDPPAIEPQPEPELRNELYKNAIFLKLENTVKNYEWGSTEWIPVLVGQKNHSRIPWAELWMGVNPGGPSTTTIPNEGNNENLSPILLSELIEKDKEFFLGKEAAETYGTLPFLFKVLAAGKPLSIQVHPNPEQAREGFNRENQAGIPLSSPERNYKNPSHKPEILCAMGPFAALCGFREASEIRELLAILSGNSGGAIKASLENLMYALKQEDENPYEAFLTALFCMGNEERGALGPYIKNQAPRLMKYNPEHKDEWELCSYFAGLYPGDPGIIAPLYLNIIELDAGEAIYIPAGIFHAYIHGMGMELMADSDNVLRGGLTPKHVDPDELLRILNFSEYKPDIIKIPSHHSSWFCYPSPAREFVLSVINCTEGEAFSLRETGPAIAIVTRGSAAVSTEESGNLTMIQKGESIFIPAGKNRQLSFHGNFTAHIASIGVTGPIP